MPERGGWRPSLKGTGEDIVLALKEWALLQANIGSQSDTDAASRALDLDVGCRFVGYTEEEGKLVNG